MKELAEQANLAYSKMIRALEEWKADHSIGEVDERGDQWDLAMDKLLEAVRKDLGVPDETPGDPVAGHSDQAKQP